MNDSQLIDELGGPSRVADLLNLDKRKGGVQRVSNWRRRGIPAAVRLQHLDIFPFAGSHPDAPPAPTQEARDAA